MPISYTSVQKKALAQVWGMAAQAPIQFALVAAPDPVVWLYKKPQEAPTGMKALEKLRKDVTGFRGTAVTIGRLEWDRVTLRFVVDNKRTTGTRLTEAAFVKAWKLGAKAAGLDRLAQLADKAAFGEEEGAEVEDAESEVEQDVPGSDTASTEETPRGAERTGPSGVAITRSKVIWTSARGTASSELTKLLKAIYSDPEVRADPALRAKAGELKKTGWKMEAFDDRILAALDTLAEASEPDAQAAALEKCKAILEGYRAALTSDPVLRVIDDNPFQKVKVRQSIEDGLEDLSKALGV